MNQSVASQTIGFIGLGKMGLPMAQKLREAGHQLIVWNREPEAYSDIKDVTVADTPQQVAQCADIVFLCVLDDTAVDQVVFGPNGIAHATSDKHLIIDHSTCLPEPTRERAKALKQLNGADWLDAPVSGGPGYALEQRLTIMAGGTDETLSRVRGLMSAYAAKVTLMGPVGAGQTAKVINQAICGVGYVLMAEVHKLAQSSGLAVERLPDCLSGGHADSALLQYAYPKIVQQDFEPVASKASQMAKDLKNVEGEMARFDLDLPIVKAARAQFAAYVEAGHGEDETASISALYDAPNAEK